MSLKTVAKNILSILDEYIPGSELLVELIFKEGLYHRPNGCVSGEVTVVSLRALAKISPQSFCAVCGNQAYHQGFSLATLWRHLQEFHILAKVCEAPTELDTLYGRIGILERYLDPSAGLVFGDSRETTFPQALENWSQEVAKSARVQFKQLTEDLKGDLGKEIARQTLRKVSPFPAAWGLLSAPALEKAKKLYQEIEDDLLDDPSLFLITNKETVKGLDSQGIQLISTLQKSFFTPGPDLMVVPASFAALTYGKSDPAQREDNCVRLKATDSPSVVEAAARLHADGGVYSSLSAALVAARSLV